MVLLFLISFSSSSTAVFFFSSFCVSSTPHPVALFPLFPFSPFTFCYLSFSFLPLPDCTFPDYPSACCGTSLHLSIPLPVSSLTDFFSLLLPLTFSLSFFVPLTSPHINLFSSFLWYLPTSIFFIFPLITPFFTHLLGVISHRDGVHACDPEEGKEAMTSFRCANLSLTYDE